MRLIAVFATVYRRRLVPGVIAWHWRQGTRSRLMITRGRWRDLPAMLSLAREWPRP